MQVPQQTHESLQQVTHDLNAISEQIWAMYQAASVAYEQSGEDADMRNIAADLLNVQSQCGLLANEIEAWQETHK